MNTSNKSKHYLKVALILLIIILTILSVLPFFPEEYFGECWVVLFMVWIMILAVWQQWARTDLFGVFSPVHVFCFIYAIYFVIGPVNLIVTGQQMVENQEDVFFVTLLYILMGLVSFLLSYRLSIGRSMAPYCQRIIWQPSRLHIKRATMACIFGFLFGTAFFVYVIHQVGGVRYIWSNMGEVYGKVFTKSMYPILLGHGFIEASLFLHFGIAIHRRKMSGYSLFLIQLFLTFLLQSMFGGRGIFIQNIFVLSFLYHVFVRRTNFLKLVSVFLLMFLFLLGYGHLRSSLSGEVQPINFSLVKFIYGFLVGTNDGMGPVLTFVSDMPKKLDFLYGKSFVQLLWQFIPRSIWNDKPGLFAGVIMKDAFFPGLWELGYSKPPTLIGELYANFHVFGIIGGMAVFGYLSGKLYLKALRECNITWMTVYAISLFYMLAEIRGDFVTASSSYLVMVFPFYAMSKYVFSRKYIVGSMDHCKVGNPGIL